jgi:hypothetical protein
MTLDPDGLLTTTKVKSKFLTTNYGTSLPSSGSTGEIFFKIVS